MRALDLAPVVLAVALLGWVGAQVKRIPARPAAADVEAASAGAAARDEPTAAVSQAGSLQLAAEGGESERESVLRRLDLSAAGTYMHDHLLDQDSTIVRWSDRSDAVRVWIQPQSAAPHWSADYVNYARDAFTDWKAAGFPIGFVFVVDSAKAEIVIGWTDRFPEAAGQQVGNTRRSYDDRYRIREAEVVIATLDSAGQPLPRDVVAGIARHEVGHALGLGHSTDPATLMYPTSRTLAVGEKDRTTLRLFYMLPPGNLKAH